MGQAEQVRTATLLALARTTRVMIQRQMRATFLMLRPAMERGRHFAG
jgi:hypothetical protein